MGRWTDSLAAGAYTDAPATIVLPEPGSTANPDRDAASAQLTASTTPPPAAGIPTASFGWGGYFQALGAVFLVLALLALALYLLKRFSPRSRLFKRGDLQLEAQLQLGPKRSVAVVRFLNKRLVLGVTDANVNLLTQTDTEHDAHSNDFDQALAQARTDIDAS